MVGERLAGVPGALSAAVRLADETGARLAWVPRRAGERGALEAGALPGLLPGGRPVDDPAARRAGRVVWNVADCRRRPGRDTAGILAAAEAKTLGALLIGGVEADDLPDPQAALAAVEAAGFVVSLELRHSRGHRARGRGVPRRTGHGEAGHLPRLGRARTRFRRRPPRAPGRCPISGCCTRSPAKWVSRWVFPTPRPHGANWQRLGAWDGDFPDPPGHPQPPRRDTRAGARRCSPRWRMLLDAGRLQDGEPNLAGTARTAGRAAVRGPPPRSGAGDGDPVTVTTERGAVTLPLVITDMPDRVVWLPLNSPGSAVYPQLAARAGDVVNVRRAAGTNGMVPGGPL